MTVDGWIPVNPLTMETAFPGVYAVGDVTSVGTPKAGVFRQKAAPTARAPAALVWPQTVPLAVAYSWMVTSGLKWMYLMKPGTGWGP